jgi:antitoxin ParD1/3/4
MLAQGEPDMKPAGQMTLTLTPELERFVRAEVKRGAFATSSEYVRDLVRERYRREQDKTDRLNKLDEALTKGIADAENGKTMPLDTAFKRLRDELGLPLRSSKN